MTLPANLPTITERTKTDRYEQSHNQNRFSDSENTTASNNEQNSNRSIVDDQQELHRLVQRSGDPLYGVRGDLLTP